MWSTKRCLAVTSIPLSVIIYTDLNLCNAAYILYVRFELMDDVKDTAPVWVDRITITFTHKWFAPGLWVHGVGANRRLTDKYRWNTNNSMNSNPLTWWRMTTEKRAWSHSWMDAYTAQTCKHKCIHKGIGHFTQTFVHLQKWRHVQTHTHSCIDYTITHAHNAILFIKQSVISHCNHC